MTIYTTFNKTYSLFLCIVLCLSFISVHAQTCNGNLISTAPNLRFSDNANGTVTDNRTGLMWQKCSFGQNAMTCNGSVLTVSWFDALTNTNSVNQGIGFAGYTDWRLPNIKELRSLVEQKCVSPAINLNVFPSTPSSYTYWSSSPAVDFGFGGNYVWVFSTNSGLVRTDSREAVTSNAVKLVRDVN